MMSTKLPSEDFPGTWRTMSLCQFQAMILFLLSCLAHAGDAGPSVSYGIDQQRSLVRIFVYRAGALKVFGHDHLVSTTVIDGDLTYTPPPALDASFKLTIPVDDLVVDDPKQREMAGGNFSAPMPAKDRRGTRKNLLSDKVLNATVFPDITITGRWRDGSSSHGTVAATIDLLNKRYQYDVPIDIEMHNDRLTVSGKLHLSQRELNIMPLSILGGTIKVADGIDVSFTLTFVPVAVADLPRQK